jgi:hypothetical protein
MKKLKRHLVVSFSLHMAGMYEREENALIKGRFEHNFFNDSKSAPISLSTKQQ